MPVAVSPDQLLNSLIRCGIEEAETSSARLAMASSADNLDQHAEAIKQAALADALLLTQSDLATDAQRMDLMNRSEDRQSRLVFITRDVERELLEGLLRTVLE